MLNFNTHKAAFIASLLSVFFVTINNCKAQNQRPNIILILADDIGYKSLSCNGGNLYSTPNIDTLAQKGMRFTQCYASPLCSPSRFMLLTGKYNFRNYTECGAMDQNEKTIGNMMKDAGYRTGFFGKQQLNGNSDFMHSWGFDAYCLFNIGSLAGSRYKNPHLYTHGAFLPDDLTLNKYGPDIVSDSVLNFIDNNKSNPFFIYYPMMSVHKPFSPTPDDPAFTTWDPEKRGDTSFFGSMVHYMDKKIGELINKLKLLGLENNTVIIFTGDNGIPVDVLDYLDDDTAVTGGKSTTKQGGTHVPLIVYWPGTISGGRINNDLVDFTDFLPTLAGIAKVPLPVTYGPLDGVSFFPRLLDQSGAPRDWIFNHYDPLPENLLKDKKHTFRRWAQTIRYKLYDTSALNNTRLFYNIENDPDEINPIPDNLLTPEEIIVKHQLLDVINRYIAQGVPILNDPEILSVTDSSATIKDSIRINGGSTITSSGIVWGKQHNPVLSNDNYSSENVSQGGFYSDMTGLNSNTTYYIRTYATNFAGTAYSKEVSFITKLTTPVCTGATEINNTVFTANWNALSSTHNYKIDVSTLPAFSVSTPDSASEGFDFGLTSGWRFNQDVKTDTMIFGKTSPSVCFLKNGSIITTRYPGFVSKLSFWLTGLKDNSGSLLVEGSDGNTWKTIENISSISKISTVKTYDSGSTPPLENGFIRFRFTYAKSTANICFDDVSVSYDSLSPSFVGKYEKKTVSGTSLQIKGLKKNTQYYYRVWAKNESNISLYSNTIAVTTKNINLASPVCTKATEILKTAFVANWNNLETADRYKIDVSASPLFSSSTPTSVTEGFNSGVQPVDGWIFSNGISIDTLRFGKASPSIRFSELNQTITSAIYPSPAIRLSFFIRGLNENSGSLLVEGFNGFSWETIENITNVTRKGITKIYDSVSFPVFKNNFIRFRFTISKSPGTIVFDDVMVKYIFTEPSFVPGYEDRTVTGNSLNITGLKNNTKYYYRVRGISINLDDTSANSNTIEAVTGVFPSPSVESIAVFPNPSADEFILTVPQQHEPVVIVTDVHGNIKYQSSQNSDGRYVFGKDFSAGVYFARIIKNGKRIKTIKLIKLNR